MVIHKRFREEAAKQAMTSALEQLNMAPEILASINELILAKGEDLTYMKRLSTELNVPFDIVRKHVEFVRARHVGREESIAKRRNNIIANAFLMAKDIVDQGKPYDTPVVYAKSKRRQAAE